MRVAFYNHTSEVSGAEINLLLIAGSLKQAEPIVFAPAGTLETMAREASLPTVRVPGPRARLSKNPLRVLRGLAGMLRAGFVFARKVRKHRIDLIHANSLRAGMMAAAFAWLHRRPIVWHVQDTPPRGAAGLVVNRLIRSSAGAVIGISDSVLKGLDSRRLEGKLNRVHNAVELREVSELEKRIFRKRLREEMGTPASGELVVIIGQITAWKRQSDAIAAVHELLARGRDAHLWIVGEARFREENKAYERSLRDEVKRLNLQERVTFTGFRTDITEICSAADLLFLCSDNEPFGRVIIEAMALSVPVVATNGGGVPEIIEHGVSGLLYETGRIDQLADGAERLMTDRSLRERIGRSAAERVKKHFAIEGAVDRIEAVYRSLVPQGGSENPRAKERRGYEFKV